MSVISENKTNIDSFLKIVDKYSDIQELTYENVHEFIDKILIHELDLETATRKIEIQYSFVGRIDGGGEKAQNETYFRQGKVTINSIVM